MDHPELYAIRRSEHGDQNGVLELDSPSKDARRSYFGRALLGAVIETSFLALTATDPTRPERVLGFAAFDSSPSGELAEAACYPAFLEHKFDLPPASAFLFLTYFAQRQGTAGAASRPPVLKHLLHTMFATLVSKRSVLLVLPEDVNIAETEPALAKFFERVPTRSTPLEAPKGKRLEQQFAKNAKTFSQFTVYQAKVDVFFPSVHVRRARVEDHDDLQPILTAQAAAVSSAFGDYFLAELIHDQDEHNVCLIAEAATTNAAGQSRAVGLLAISDQIDVATLQDNFALSALNDLAKSNGTTALGGDKMTPPRLVIAGPPAGGKGTQSQKLRLLINRGEMTPPKLVISGPPAGGKGTQCEQLVALLNVVHLSTGDMLRQAIRDKSPLGMQAQSFMDGGQLVPDELIVDVVLERITQPDCESRGWLLDGFPRTATQAEALLAARGGKAAPDCVLVLDVPDEEVIRRIAGRRVDPETGKTYHVEFNPPPPEVQARVIQRSDDTEATLRTRLEQFHAHSDGVLAAFEAFHGVQIVRADGLQPASLIAKAFVAPTIQRGVETEARVLQRTGAESLSKLARAEAHFNCFAITLFCVGDDAFERSSSADLLVAAFATFTTRDYCLLTLPTHAREPPCLAFFSRITARPASAFTHALYVLHRDAISFFCPQTSDGRGVLHPVQINVQRLLSSGDDVAELSPLMAGLSRQTRQALDQELASANEEAEIDLEDSPRHAAFVVRANGQVVGLAALARHPEVATLLPHHFDIDRVARMEFHRAKDLAFVRHLILNPIFASCSRFFLLELMRLFRKTCLIYQVPTGPGANTSSLTSPSCSAALEEFVLAPPRRGAHTTAGKALGPATKDTEGVSDDVKDERERVRRAAVCAAFALFVLPKRLLSESKMTVNQRVVFVGASDAALSCLARLLVTPYLHFSNLSLVSPHGLTLATMDEGDDDTVTPRPSDFARKSTFTAVELEQYSLRTHVRVIESRMVRVDRETRAVILQDGSCIPYDYLALTTGLQDGTCCSLGKLPRFVDEDFGDGTTTAAMYYPPVVPKQLMALGDLPTAQKLHTALNKTQATTEGSIVVYGSSLLALQVIQGLLVRGISGSRIHHISPSRDNGCGVFEDTVVRSEMEKQYATSGVTLRTATKIVDIETVSGNDDELEGVRVSALDGAKSSIDEYDSAEKGELIPCSWLLCCQHNDSDADVFRAVNESGLVYDGRLVVDGYMRTTDAHVLGAGSLCRFSRRFIAAKLHENYSSREGGELLAKSLLQLLDPLAVPEPSEVHPLPTQPTKTPMVPPPEMELPVVRSAVVLGGRFYVQISIPTLTNTLALQSLPTNTATRATDVNLIDMDTHAQSRPTSGASIPSRYTCLLFDDVGVLNRLEYLGDGPVPVRDLQNLVGLHEAYLNSALASYSAGKVHDWVAFFAHPWANALYHDRFPAFRAKLRTLLAKDDGVRAIADDAVAFMRETGDTKGAMALAQERVGRGGSALEPSTRRLVESQVLEFLGSNRDVLNMFLLPKGGGAGTRPGSK
ncbi:Cilia- and flagella-associated protein 61, N-terminal domain [Phytophthora cactorum]|nr:Cilia- and flagella-associated protein 61, N-terminal domain [Phytophthora cactorum]